MKKQILKTMLAAGCAVGFVFCCGCVASSSDDGNTTAINSSLETEEIQNSGKTGKPLATTEKVILLEQRQEQLRMTVQTEGKSPDEQSLAAKIEAAVTKALSRDVVIGRAGQQDVQLLIRPSLTTVDQSGDYYRMNCEIMVELKAVVSGQIFGGTQIKIVNQKRILGKEAAVSQFENSAAETAAGWCRAELKRIVDTEMAIAVLNIQLPTPKAGESRDPQRDAAAIQTIGNHLSKMSNVISYELKEQDMQKGTCQYRIAYFKSAYPNGIANEVSTLLDSIVIHK